MDPHLACRQRIGNMQSQPQIMHIQSILNSTTDAPSCAGNEKPSVPNVSSSRVCETAQISHVSPRVASTLTEQGGTALWQVRPSGMSYASQSQQRQPTSNLHFSIPSDFHHPNTSCDQRPPAVTHAPDPALIKSPQAMALKIDQISQGIPLDVQKGSATAKEKRRRNAMASKHCRARRESKIKNLEDKIEGLTEAVINLRNKVDLMLTASTRPQYPVQGSERCC